MHYHVEGHQPEIPLVADAIAATQARLAIAENIPGRSEPGGEIVPVFPVNPPTGLFGAIMTAPFRIARNGLRPEAG